MVKNLWHGIVFISALTGGCMSDRECNDRCDYRVDTERDQMQIKINNLEKELCVWKFIGQSCSVMNIPPTNVCPR